jgi:hypothetical protein
VAVDGGNMNPYKEKILDNGLFRRTFSKDTDSTELVWHRDKEDRIVKPLNESGWMIQMDNKLPVILDANKEYMIPKNTFHRIIKGGDDLIVDIKKL